MILLIKTVIISCIVACWLVLLLTGDYRTIHLLHPCGGREIDSHSNQASANNHLMRV